MFIVTKNKYFGVGDERVVLNCKRIEKTMDSNGLFSTYSLCSDAAGVAGIIF